MVERLRKSWWLPLSALLLGGGGLFAFLNPPGKRDWKAVRPVESSFRISPGSTVSIPFTVRLDDRYYIAKSLPEQPAQQGESKPFPTPNLQDPGSEPDFSIQVLEDGQPVEIGSDSTGLVQPFSGSENRMLSVWGVFRARPGKRYQLEIRQGPQVARTYHGNAGIEIGSATVATGVGYALGESLDPVLHRICWIGLIALGAGFAVTSVWKFKATR